MPTPKKRFTTRQVPEPARQAPRRERSGRVGGDQEADEEGKPGIYRSSKKSGTRQGPAFLHSGGKLNSSEDLNQRDSPQIVIIYPMAVGLPAEAAS